MGKKIEGVLALFGVPAVLQIILSLVVLSETKGSEPTTTSLAFISIATAILYVAIFRIILSLSPVLLMAIKYFNGLPESDRQEVKRIFWQFIEVILRPLAKKNFVIGFIMAILQSLRSQPEPTP